MIVDTTPWEGLVVVGAGVLLTVLCASLAAISGTMTRHTPPARIAVLRRASNLFVASLWLGLVAGLLIVGGAVAILAWLWGQR